MKKQTENCPVCGRLMNREVLRDKRRIARCIGETTPFKHSTLVWLGRARG